MRRYRLRSGLRAVEFDPLHNVFQNPPGSTPAVLRMARKERRKRRMRLRKLRGWH